jgi:hypothetical protein
MAFSRNKGNLKTSLYSNWNSIKSGILNYSKFEVTKIVTLFVLLQFFTFINFSEALADSNACSIELQYSDLKLESNHESADVFSDSDFSKNGATTFTPHLKLNAKDVQTLHTLSWLWEEDNFILLGLSDLQESGIPEALTNELISVANKIADQINGIDSPLKFGKFKNQFHGKSVHLTRIWIRNEKARPVNKNGKIRCEL